MNDTDIQQAFKDVRLSLIQRCIVAVEMADSHKEALQRLQDIQNELTEEE